MTDGCRHWKAVPDGTFVLVLLYLINNGTLYLINNGTFVLNKSQLDRRWCAQLRRRDIAVSPVARYAGQERGSAGPTGFNEVARRAGKRSSSWV